MKPGESMARIEEFKRSVLAGLLALCTDAQRELFARMYPKGPSEAQFGTAVDQCERTVIRNQARARQDGGTKP